jgi:hypothetical protein
MNSFTLYGITPHEVQASAVEGLNKVFAMAITASHSNQAQIYDKSINCMDSLYRTANYFNH